MEGDQTKVCVAVTSRPLGAGMVVVWISVRYDPLPHAIRSTADPLALFPSKVLSPTVSVCAVDDQAVDVIVLRDSEYCLPPILPLLSNLQHPGTGASSRSSG